MGVTSSRPTWLLVASLVAAFAGWRIFDGQAAVRIPLLALGVAGLLVAAGWRLRAWRRAEGEERAIAAVFAFGTLGCLVGVACFVPVTEGGVELLNLDFERVTERLRLQRFFFAVAPIVLSCSLLPVLGAQWAAGKGGSEGALPVDALRARETSAAALSLGVAGAALMLVGYVTTALDRTADFSYFKTSRPGEAVREIVMSLEGPLEAAFFFPPVNAVKDEALEYFRKLARATNRVAVEEYDRFVDLEAAADYGARRDGSIFLRVAGRTEQVRLPLELDDGRSELRVLDSRVQRALLLLVRERRYAYLTTGHGELNDPLGADPAEDPANQWMRDLRRGTERSTQPPARLEVLRNLLTTVNYEAREFGIAQGLGHRIPNDAAMVMIIGPQTPFLEEEMNAIREYLGRGGSLLVALEPESGFRFEELGDLGIEYDEAMTLDDANFVPERLTIADRRNIFTNRFSAHAAVTTASRRGVATAVLMIGPGRLTPAEDAGDLRATLIVNSMPTSFQDRNGDFRFNRETEVRGSHGIAAAVEGVAGEGAEEDDDGPPGLRALVYGDAEMFSGRVLRSLALQREVVVDGIRWLGREEEFAGEVVSEEDVAIHHTRSENVIWFYAIIFGAPALVLGAGLSMLYGRRRRPRFASAS